MAGGVEWRWGWGLGGVSPDASGLDGHEEDGKVVGVLERGEDLEPGGVRDRAVDPEGWDAAEGEVVLELVESCDPAGEDEALGG